MPITLDSIKNKMIGHTFGKLTITSYVGKSETGDNLWKARCECGVDVVGRTAGVSKPNSGCTRCKKSSGLRLQTIRTALLGRRFGRLTVTEYAGAGKHQFSLWKCKCDCGNETITKTASLTSGVTQSCGCYGREKLKQANTKHGLHDHPLYSVWYAMKDRCYNDQNDRYCRYGNRGIKVCDAWFASFINFYNWAISKGYHQGLTLERVDNDGDYEPGNCKWATRKEQGQNTSLTKLTQEQITAIRNDKRLNYVIASDYDVDASTISRVKSKTTWSNIRDLKV